MSRSKTAIVRLNLTKLQRLLLKKQKHLTKLYLQVKKIDEAVKIYEEALKMHAEETNDNALYQARGEGQVGNGEPNQRAGGVELLNNPIVEKVLGE